LRCAGQAGASVRAIARRLDRPAAQTGGHVVCQGMTPARRVAHRANHDPTRILGCGRDPIGGMQAPCSWATWGAYRGASRVREGRRAPATHAKHLRTEGKRKFRRARLMAERHRRGDSQRARPQGGPSVVAFFGPLEISPASYCRSASRAGKMQMSSKLKMRLSAPRAFTLPRDRAEVGRRGRRE
jgi:hypothetical protein